MRNLNPEITKAVTRNLDFRAILRDITTLNRDNENLIKWAFGERSADTPNASAVIADFSILETETGVKRFNEIQEQLKEFTTEQYPENFQYLK